MRLRPVRFEDLIDSENAVTNEIERVHSEIEYMKVMQNVRQEDTQTKLSKIEDMLEQLLANRQQQRGGTAATAAPQPVKSSTTPARRETFETSWPEQPGLMYHEIRIDQLLLMDKFEKLHFDGDYVAYNKSFQLLVDLRDPDFIPYHYLQGYYLEPLPDDVSRQLWRLETKTLEELYALGRGIQLGKSLGNARQTNGSAKRR